MIQGLSKQEYDNVMALAKEIIKLPDDYDNPHYQDYESITSEGACRGSFEFGVLLALTHITFRHRTHLARVGKIKLV